MDDDFLREQRRAIERMNEMYRDRQIKTGGYKMPPAPPFVRVNGVGEVAEKEGVYKNKETAENKSEKVNKAKLDKNSNQTNSNSAPRFSFLKNGILDKDISLILGLILILANEKADKRLLLALLYILM